MTNHPKPQLRKKLVLLPQHLVVLKRTEHQCKKVGGPQCHCWNKRAISLWEDQIYCEKHAWEQDMPPKCCDMVAEFPEWPAGLYPTLSSNQPLLQRALSMFSSQKFSLPSVWCLLIKHQLPAFANWLALLWDAVFVINRRSFCSVSPCQHPSAFSSPQFISAANGQQPNLNQTEFNMSDIDFVFTQYVYRLKKKKRFWWVISIFL